MEIEKIFSRLDSLEDQLKSISNSLLSMNTHINEVDERANAFLGMVRDQNKEIARLNSAIMGLGKFDGAINQIRTDFNRKIEEMQTQHKQEEQIRANLIAQDLKNMQGQFEPIKKEIKNDYEKRFVVFIEENTRLVNKFKEIEEKNKENIVSSDDLKISLSALQQDVRRTIKQVESMKADQDLQRDSQSDMRSKIETITDSLRTSETRLNELVATESERRQNQLDFMEKQSVQLGDREKTWAEWSQQFDHTISQVNDLLPDLQKQQFTLKQTKEDLDSATQQFERRIKEITEMNRLMDEKFKKEWDTFKADAEKRWANISLVLNDSQGGYLDKLKSLQERMVFIEDNNHEMQEVLLLMSTEVQKGMQNIMKMVNGWMDAFSHIKTSR